MELLLFQLQAPLAAWGEPAVGEFRGTAEYPSLSALLGLLGAALGVQRQDEPAHAALRDGYRFAIGVQSGGELLRDYQTAQVPSRSALKGRPQATRRDELRMPKSDLGTILSTRDYRQDASCIVALQARETAPYTLADLSDALNRPRFVLYLGRKSCPPAAPLWPQLVQADSLREGFEQYRARLQAACEAHPDRRGRVPLEEIRPITRIAFEDGMDPHLQADLTIVRKDRLLRRRGWQFGDRAEHHALLAGGKP